MWTSRPGSHVPKRTTTAIIRVLLVFSWNWIKFTDGFPSSSTHLPIYRTQCQNTSNNISNKLKSKKNTRLDCCFKFLWLRFFFFFRWTLFGYLARVKIPPTKKTLDRSTICRSGVFLDTFTHTKTPKVIWVLWLLFIFNGQNVSSLRFSIQRRVGNYFHLNFKNYLFTNYKYWNKCKHFITYIIELHVIYIS